MKKLSYISSKTWGRLFGENWVYFSAVKPIFHENGAGCLQLAQGTLSHCSRRTVYDTSIPSRERRECTYFCRGKVSCCAWEKLEAAASLKWVWAFTEISHKKLFFLFFSITCEGITYHRRHMDLFLSHRRRRDIKSFFASDYHSLSCGLVCRCHLNVLKVVLNTTFVT